MSSKKVEELRAIYSEYIAQSVRLHNNLLAFTKSKGIDTGIAFRGSIRKIRKLENDMVRLSKEIHNEYKEERKEMRARLKEIRKQKPRKIPVHKGKLKNDND